MTGVSWEALNDAERYMSPVACLPACLLPPLHVGTVVHGLVEVVARGGGGLTFSPGPFTTTRASCIL